jgi:hypothetical protein
VANDRSLDRDEGSLIEQCRQKLAGHYTILAAIIGGSSATNPETALDLDIAFIVREDVLDRAHLKLSGTSVDLFVCGNVRLRREMEQGLHPHLMWLFLVGRHVYGDPSISANLIRVAQTVAGRPAPPLSDGAKFAYRSRPHNLLKKFQSLKRDDNTTAGLIVSALVQASVDGFFALNGLWGHMGIREVANAISRQNPIGAAALSTVVEAPLAALREEPELLERMVAHLIGDEPKEEETWIVQTPASRPR